VVEEDITEHCKMLVDIVEGMQDKDKRLTALKVMEIWQQKLKKLKPPSALSVEDRESILLHALVEGVLKEEFHFTPYSTISYIGVGRKAHNVKRSTTKICVRKMVLDRKRSTGTNRDSMVPTDFISKKGICNAGTGKVLTPNPSKSLPRTRPNAMLTNASIQPAPGHGKGTIEAPRQKADETSLSAAKRVLPPMLLPSEASGSTSDVISRRKRLKLSKRASHEKAPIIID
jgi:ATP-dependent DNA helicase Q1